MATIFNSHHLIISTILWDPHTDPKKTFLSFFIFFFLCLSLEHLQDREVELVKLTWGSWTLWSIYKEILPKALPKKQQSIPMPFYSPRNFSKCNVNWTLWSKFKEIIIASVFLSVRTFVKHLMGTKETPFNTNYDNKIQSQVISQSLQNHFLKL